MKLASNSSSPSQDRATAVPAPASPRNWGLQISTKTLQIATNGNNDVQNITEQVHSLLKQVGLSNGIVTLFVQGSTAGLTTLEFEAGVIADLEMMFERVASADLPYQHEARWHDGNGHSHVRAALLGPSLVVPFTERQLTLGTWQQIVLVDFDTRPRRREIIVQFMGG
ncbi:MAG: YjbQ family protein [Chloroflexi bacterium]|nr:YjbQ family protein [Chloroflexota bacterium]